MLNIENFLKKVKSIDVKLSMVQESYHNLTMNERKKIIFFRRELQRTLSNVKAFCNIK